MVLALILALYFAVAMMVLVMREATHAIEKKTDRFNLPDAVISSLLWPATAIKKIASQIFDAIGP